MGTPLSRSVAGVLDSTGRADLELGPAPTWESWTFNSLTVSSDSSSPVTAAVYRGSPGDDSLLDSTPDGRAQTTDTVMTLQPGNRLTIRFDGGTPGARCSVTADGTRTAL